ncbi:hypothetical protein [Haloarchaeobius sp. TZWSO28]|uniref:hypothetical protein n=1 Tax=Haloarchaeobius sp. TZWSO28 TaxID=3446119 RepID=UPI003EB7DD59
MSAVVRSVNAVLTWMLVFGLIALAGFAYTRETTLLAVLAAFIAVLAAGPAITRGSMTQVAPWPLVTIACVPLTTRIFGSEVFIATGSDLKLWALSLANEHGLYDLVPSVSDAKLWAVSLATKYDLDYVVWTARDAKLWALAVGDRFGFDLAYYFSWDFVLYLRTTLVNSGFESVFMFVDAASLAAVALLGVALLQQFTSLRMTTSFGRLFVAVSTMGLTGFWGIARWFATDAFGVTLVTTNDRLMYEFAIASVAGIVVAVLFARYFCRSRPEEDSTAAMSPTRGTGSVATDGGEPTPLPGEIAEPAEVTATTRRRLPERAAALLVRLMQLSLLGIAYIGYQQESFGILVNALGAFTITFLPAILGRDRRFTLHVYLTFWLTGAVLFHAAGTLGPYGDIVWYDDLAHTLSASVVAAVGYATARSLEAHSETLRLTPWFTFLYLLLFVMAAGVVWELLEFGVMFVADRAGQPAPIVQSGLDDTVSDLIYDTIGGVVVALFGSVYLTDAPTERPDVLERRSA